jgi:hypothetical protein
MYSFLTISFIPAADSSKSLSMYAVDDIQFLFVQTQNMIGQMSLILKVKKTFYFNEIFFNLFS